MRVFSADEITDTCSEITGHPAETVGEVLLAEEVLRLQERINEKEESEIPDLNFQESENWEGY